LGTGAQSYFNRNCDYHYSGSGQAVMLGWILKKVGGKAIGSVLAPFKMYLIAAAIAAVVGAVGYYVFTAERAKGRVLLLESKISQYVTANAIAESEINNLNNRITAHNEQKLKDIDRAEAKLKTAQTEAKELKAEKEVISEQLAVATFTITEAIRDDEEYADWAYYPTHITVWDQLYAADQGTLHPE
jgi:hypothetical protein